MILLQLFSCDAHVDVIVLLVEVVAVDELAVARRALPSAYAALHSERRPLLLVDVTLRERNQVSLCCFSGQADG